MPRSTASLAFAVVALLSACQGYDYTINDKVVYSPNPLFRDFDLPDEALRTCVEQAIVDNRVSAPGQLAALNCSHAGIESLEGLAVFTGLVSLKLSDNNIRNLVELGQLKALRSVYLQNNAIVDPVPLAALPLLSTLDLSGNAALQCPRAGSFDRVETLTLPEHCGRDEGR